MTVQDLVYQYLTHGADKNNLSLQEANDRANDAINRMSNVEFLELVSDMIEQRLEQFEKYLEVK